MSDNGITTKGNTMTYQLQKGKQQMTLEQAAMAIAKTHHVHENDAHRALILTRAHLRRCEPGDGKRMRLDRDWDHEYMMLDHWLTHGTEWVEPDWADHRDAASWLLHRNVACTWAITVAHSRKVQEG